MDASVVVVGVESADEQRVATVVEVLVEVVDVDSKIVAKIINL